MTPRTPFAIARQFLMDYLRDEFARYPEVRIRFFLEDQEDGIMAKTEAREYFFPTAWVEALHMDKVKEQVRKMKEVLPERG